MPADDRIDGADSTRRTSQSVYFGSIENRDLWRRLRPHLCAERLCVVCGGTRLEDFASLEYLVAKRCRDCEMVSVNPHYDDDGLELFYAECFKHRQDDLELQRLRDRTYEIDRDWVSKFVDGGSVLDVGCSGGFFLSKFSPKKWNRFGVEIAEDAAQFSQKTFGIPVRVGRITDLDFDQSFDLIVLRGVIEHVRDPVPMLAKCASLLKPGGALFITATPNGGAFAFDVYRERWHLFTPLEHIHFFTIRHLGMLLSPMGVEPVAHHYPYEETPYANQASDFSKIRSDIVALANGRADEVNTSVPFPGSMLTGLWRKG